MILVHHGILGIKFKRTSAAKASAIRTDHQSTVNRAKESFLMDVRLLAARYNLPVRTVALNADAFVSLNNRFRTGVLRGEGFVVPVVGGSLVGHSLVGNRNGKRASQHGGIGVRGLISEALSIGVEDEGLGDGG